jgi:O-antigen/teichoic acid export membrane protein
MGKTTDAVADAEPRRAPSIWRRVRKDALLLGVGSAGVIASQLAFRALALAHLSAASYGRLSLVLSVYNTVMIIGASGLPNITSRYIALRHGANDRPVIASAMRAAAIPVLVATVIAMVVTGVLLHTPVTIALTVVGLPSLVYSLIAMGVLRGRGRLVGAAAVQPAAAAVQVAILALVILGDPNITPTEVFAAFCLGNFAGLAVGLVLMKRSRPTREAADDPGSDSWETPTPTQMLGRSMWLAGATIGVSVLPLIMRSVAALDSYTVVAMIDVALVLLTIPQRVGVILVQAVIPHATLALVAGGSIRTISRREHAIVIAPFVLVAAVVAWTPVVSWLFDALGTSEYDRSASYLALAMLAGPARILYGLVQGVLVAQGEGRFLAWNAWTVSTAAAAAMLALTLLGSTVLAFVVFVVACWAIYVQGLRRIERVDSDVRSL